LAQIDKEGGVVATIARAKEMSAYFRESIKALPLKAYTPFMPNAMTTLTPTDGKSAMDIVNDLEEGYKVWFVQMVENKEILSLEFRIWVT
jgi:aspartate aminotransferase-like enzyme